MKHSSRRRKEIEHGTIDGTGADSEAFRFGYFYRTIEDHVNAYAAQAGNEDSFSDIAFRVSQLLEAARRYGNGWSFPNWCPKCGKTVREIAEEDRRDIDLMNSGQRRTYMFAHATMSH